MRSNTNSLTRIDSEDSEDSETQPTDPVSEPAKKRVVTHINELSVGDSVMVCERKTPMVVDKIIEPYVYLSNHYTDGYRLRYYDDGAFSFHVKRDYGDDSASDVEVVRFEGRRQ